MADIAKSTDLTRLEGDPTPGADVHLPFEDLEVHGWLNNRHITAGLKLRARIAPRSNLAAAAATLLVIAIGCGAALTLAAIGAPAWLALGGLIVTVAVFLEVRYRRGS